MSPPTYNLFFTGRDDPRSCVVIGEDTKPVYFCFETPERNMMMPNLRTTVTTPACSAIPCPPNSPKLYRNNKEACARFEWSPGNHLGSATIGSRQLPMSHLVLSGSSTNARAFVSADGKKFEWRQRRDNSTSYDLFSSQNVQIAAFRRYSQTTFVGPSHGLLQYTFNHDLLLVEALLALCLNRWIDLHGV